MNIQLEQQNSITQAVLFATHVWSEPICSRFIKLRDELDSSADVYLLLDESNAEVTENWRKALGANSAKQIFSFTLNSLLLLGFPTFKANTLVPGSAHFPVLLFAQEKTYTYYWIVEYDVQFMGNWKELLDNFNEQPHDLLCSHITIFPDIPNWPWWRSLEIPKRLYGQINLSAKTFLKGFFPIYRISKAGIMCVLEAHRNGWTGHYETLVPSALSNSGLLVEDFNSLGRFYSPGGIAQGEGALPLSSLRWQPNIRLSELTDHDTKLLFHPIK
jgi:hypothetical protein